MQGSLSAKKGLLLLDTLTSAKEAQRFISDIRKVSDKPVRYVINTHYHLDHSFGNAEFEKMGAIIISHDTNKKNLQNNGETTLKNAGAYGLSESDMEGTKLAYPSLTFYRQDVYNHRRPKSGTDISRSFTYEWEHHRISA